MEIRARYVLIGVFTLLVIAAGFGFVYWINNAAAFAARTSYRVEFDNSVSGLLRGSPVLFNGIRVGEVTGLGLKQDDPSKIVAAIAVDPAAPVRQDTTVELSFQGLTGSAAISLRGGSSDAPALPRPAGQAPLLVAAAGSGQDITSSARSALQDFSAILQENREPLKSTISSLDTFSAALARNSDKLDGIVAGLSQLTGGGGGRGGGITFDVSAPKDFGKIDLPTGQLAVAEPTTVVAFNSQRILGRDGEKMSPIEGAQWADSVPLLVQAHILEGIENAGFHQAGRPDDNFTAAATLKIEIRDFTLAIGPMPAANVELSAKLVDGDGKVIAADVFQANAPAAAVDAMNAAKAMNAAFGTVSKNLVTWALTNAPR